MDKYEVKLTPKAFRDLDEIYLYIAHELSVPETALNVIADLENAVLGLEVMPERGAIRKIGAYAGKGYRQIFVGNYIIIYRVKMNNKLVVIVTIKYMPRNF